VLCSSLHHGSVSEISSIFDWLSISFQFVIISVLSFNRICFDSVKTNQRSCHPSLLSSQLHCQFFEFILVTCIIIGFPFIFKRSSIISILYYHNCQSYPGLLPASKPLYANLVQYYSHRLLYSYIPLCFLSHVPCFWYSIKYNSIIGSYLSFLPYFLLDTHLEF